MDNFHRLAAVILAAGESSRFGKKTKQLAQLNGKYLIDIVIENSVQAGFSCPLLVLGANEEEIRLWSTLLHQCKVVTNPDWKQGMSSSIKAAISSIPQECHGAVFLLADQPLLSAALLTKMARQFIKEQPHILYPQWRNMRGNPAIISSSLFPQLLNNTGDRGGRFLFDRKDLTICQFPVADQACLLDIDTQEDLNQLRSAIRTQQD